MVNALHIGFLVFPRITQLDATGPAQVLARVPGAKIHMVWKTLDPVMTDAGFAIVPTDTYESCPDLDVVCVPGGFGQIDLMTDEPTLAFLRKQAEKARYVTSVCTGSLLLAAAGLLRGYQATCHWGWRDMLSAFGAEPVAARVVRDKNRITGGGVTAGIDFGLTIAAELAGEEAAKLIQLYLEYDPAPPFDCGTPAKAGPARVADFRKATEESNRRREAVIQEATARASSSGQRT
jgi:cyclohexyl-isocyanide hydratase